MIFEGKVEFDRLDDSGDIWASVVEPDGWDDRSSAVVIEIRSILGDDWWTEHQNDPELRSSIQPDWVDKGKVGEQHPAELRDLVGKRVRVTVEVLDD